MSHCHGNTTTSSSAGTTAAQSRRGGVGTGITGETGLLGRGGWVSVSGEVRTVLWKTFTARVVGSRKVRLRRVVHAAVTG